MGKVATSPLPPRGSPLATKRGRQNHKWPYCGQGGYVTPAASRIPSASKRGTKSEVAHLWARWLRNPCRLGDPLRLRVGGKIGSGPLVGKVATSCRLGDPLRLRAGGKIKSGPLVGKVATPPLPPRGSPPLQSGGQNQKWPTSGQGGYIIRAALGIPFASGRGAKSEVAHLWARWLRNPCRLGHPLRFRTGDKIRSGPIVGKMATSPLPPRGSPPLHRG